MKIKILYPEIHQFFQSLESNLVLNIKEFPRNSFDIAKIR